MKPAVDYDLNPKTFDGLLQSVEAQIERKQKWGYVNRDESVVVEPEAILELLQIVDRLRGAS